jgi:hypothetical protein
MFSSFLGTVLGSSGNARQNPNLEYGVPVAKPQASTAVSEGSTREDRPRAGYHALESLRMALSLAEKALSPYSTFRIKPTVGNVFQLLEAVEVH